MLFTITRRRPSVVLQSRLADDVARLQRGIGSLHLVRADFTDVTNRVRKHVAMRIAAAMDHQHFEHRNVHAMGFDEGDIGRAGLRLDHDGLEFRHGPRAVNLLFQFVERHAQPVGDLRQVLLHLFWGVAQKQYAEGGIVVYENAAFAVKHGAARGDDGNRAHAIALGHLRVAVRVDDLQFPETEKQQRNHPHDHVGNDGQPVRRQAFIIH
jgi:hypothetical protein